MTVAVTGKNVPRVAMPAQKQAIHSQQTAMIANTGKSAPVATKRQPQTTPLPKRVIVITTGKNVLAVI